MGSKWKNAPVYFVIAQVRFSPVLNIESYIRDIQEIFRKVGFPDYRVTQQLLINLNVNLQQNPATDTALTAPRANQVFVFSNQAKTQMLLLDSNSLTFQTTAYETFEHLSGLFFSRFEEVADRLELSYSERVGLRYLDAVMPKDGEGLEQYLVPGVLGLHSYVEKGLVLSFSESRIQSGNGMILSRVVRQNGQIGFPFDLHPTAQQMVLDRRFSGHSGSYAILDTDGYAEERHGLNIAKLKEKLAALHTQVDDAFRSTITEYAIRQWQ